MTLSAANKVVVPWGSQSRAPRRPGPALVHRQSRSGVRSSAWIWNFLIDRQDDGVGGRIDIEADDVTHFLGEPGSLDS